MAEEKRMSQTEKVIYSLSGSRITLHRPLGFEIETLPPEPEEEISYLEPVASSEEDDVNNEPDSEEENRSSGNMTNSTHSDIVASSEEEDVNCETDSEEDDRRSGNLMNTTYSNTVDCDCIGEIERHYPLHIIKLYEVPEIYVELPYIYNGLLEAIPISNEEKNEEMEKMPKKIKDRSVHLRTSDRSEMFKIKGKFDFQHDCKVTVKFGGNDINQHLDFYAVIKQDGQWVEIPAELKDNTVSFKSRKIDYFYIVSSPKTTVAELKKDISHTYVHESNPQTTIHFPEGSVENDTNISIEVVPVTKERLEILKNVFTDAIIKNMSSDVVSVRVPETKELQKHATLQLRMEGEISSEKYKTLLVRTEDGQTIVSEENIKDNGNGTYSCDLRNINKCGFIQTTQPLVGSTLNLEAVRDQFLIAIHEAKPCRVMTFLNQHKKRIRTEIVQIENRFKVHYALKQKEFVCLAEDVRVITLRKEQIVRAHLSGTIRSPSTSESLGLCVVFQPFVERNYMEFEFELSDSMGTSGYGEIRYYSDNDEREIYTLHFDPRVSEKGVVTCGNLTTQRSKTMTDLRLRQPPSRSPRRSPPLSSQSARGLCKSAIPHQGSERANIAALCKLSKQSERTDHQ